MILDNILLNNASRIHKYLGSVTQVVELFFCSTGFVILLVLSLLEDERLKVIKLCEVAISDN